MRKTKAKTIKKTVKQPVKLRPDEIAFWGRFISKVKDPEEPQDVATKKYVDENVGGGGATYTAGANITIENNVISATDTKYTAGSNISISDENVISATDTTYSNFTGTDGTAAGTAGLVPAPATTDADKFLKADGTWETVGGGSSVNVVQTTGTSATDVMSQVATSQMIYPSGYESSKTRINIGLGSVSSNRAISIGTKDTTIASGSDSIAIGCGARATNASAVAIGGDSSYNTVASNQDSIAIGRDVTVSHQNSCALIRYSTTSRQYELSLGSGSPGSEAAYQTKYIAHVKDPQYATDAANKRYVDSFYPVGTVYTSTSSTAPTFAGGTWSLIGTQTIGSTPVTVYYYERTA